MGVKELTNNLGIGYVVASAKQETNVKNSFLNLIASIYDTMFADQEGPNEPDSGPQNEISGMRSYMSSNIDSVYTRGARMDMLMDQSVSLGASSQNFYRSAKKSSG